MSEVVESIMRGGDRGFFLICLPASYGQEADTPTPDQPAKPEIKQLSAHEFQIGKIHLDQKKREISFGAGINMTQGLLEFLLVTTQSNKVHEALLLSDISPLNLNVAFKLLGIAESPELFEIVDENYRPTGVYPEVDPKISAAAKVDIMVEWGEGDQKKSQLLGICFLSEVVESIMRGGDRGFRAGGSVAED